MDALSADGREGLVIIAFVGSVFSPYYAWARDRGPADPADHCALNLSLYGPRRKRWCMTERGAGRVAREPHRLAIGPSAVEWNGRWLEVTCDEMAMPLPRRLRGRVRIHPHGLSAAPFALDGAARHQWWPASPSCTVEVDMDHPGVRWRGSGYLDANWGGEPLERGFRRWDWCRAPLGDGGTAILYDVTPRLGADIALALRCAPRGDITPFPPPPRVSLPATRVWHIPRTIQASRGPAPEVAKTLEDTPFYARSLVRTEVLGQRVTAMHESLCLQRFSRPWVRLLLPFRMPRVPGPR